jgi:hypothetical protein
LLQLCPSSVESCQCTLDAPAAAALKLTVVPGLALPAVGWVVIFGAAPEDVAARSMTQAGPALVLECGPVAVRANWNLRAVPPSLRGTVTVTEALPELQGLVAGARARRSSEKRQLVAPSTTAISRTLPPAAGSCAGVAVNRPILALVTRLARMRSGIIGALERLAGASEARTAGGEAPLLVAIRPPRAKLATTSAAAARPPRRRRLRAVFVA